MNTLSGTFRFVVLGLIVIVAAGCCCLPFIQGISYIVQIGNQHRGEYVKWKQPGFDNALIQLCEHGGTYCLKAKLDNGRIIDRYHPKGSDCTNCSLENIRTVKVTKSKVADNTANGQSVANDPNVMHKIQSAYPEDIKKVLDALATPTPIPIH